MDAIFEYKLIRTIPRVFDIQCGNHDETMTCHEDAVLLL